MNRSLALLLITVGVATVAVAQPPPSVPPAPSLRPTLDARPQFRGEHLDYWRGNAMQGRFRGKEAEQFRFLWPTLRDGKAILQEMAERPGPESEQAFLALAEYGPAARVREPGPRSRPGDPDTISLALTHLKDVRTDPRVRVAGVRAMGAIGPDPKDEKQVEAVTRALEELQRERDVTLRLEAAIALARINPKNTAPLGDLLSRLDLNRDRSGREAILAAIRAAGPHAAPTVPQLVTAWRRAQPGAALPPEEGREARWAMLDALAAIGPAAAEAVPALADVLMSKDMTERIRRRDLLAYRDAVRIVETLGEIGPAAGKLLAEVLTRPEFRDVRTEVILALARIGTPTYESLRELDTAIRDSGPPSQPEAGSLPAAASVRIDPTTEDPKVLGRLAFAVGVRHEHAALVDAAAAAADPAIVPALVEALKAPRVTLDRQLTLVRVLGAHGPAAREAVPAIVAVMANPGKASIPMAAQRLELEAAAALIRIDPANEKLVLRPREKGDPFSKGEDTPELLVEDVLRRAIKDKRPIPSLAVAAGVLRIDPENPAALALLERALLPEPQASDPRRDRLPREEALRVLAADPRAARALLPALAVVARTRDWETQVLALGVIGRLKGNAEEVLPVAVLLLADPDVRVRVAAAAAVGWVPDHAKDALAVLTAALKDPTSTVWREAVRGLGEMGPLGPAAKDAIAAIAGFGPQADVLVARAKIDPTNRAAVAALVDALGPPKMMNAPPGSFPHRGADLRLMIEALGDLGPAVKDTDAPARLAALFKDEKAIPATRHAAGRALMRIDPEAAKKAGVK